MDIYMDENIAIPEAIASSFNNLVGRASHELGISGEHMLSLKSVRALKYRNQRWRSGIHHAWIIAAVIALILIVSPILLQQLLWMKSSVGYFILDKYFSWYDTSLLRETCVVPMFYPLWIAFRHPVSCDECATVIEVHKTDKLSQEEFLEKYADSMQPLIVTDGQTDWSANETFSFDFFRSIYSEGSRALERAEEKCQFFPYETEFTNLTEMLNMSRDRVEGRKEPWYVGWSNCDGKAANILRKHYKFPYFLSPQLDHSKTDWIFMGLPGHGAEMHIDSVQAVSWQAQIKGTKKWVLESPPECAGSCAKRIEAIVQPGDIFVVDTNKWFHSTLILGNETSIVIGSEFY